MVRRPVGGRENSRDRLAREPVGGRPAHSSAETNLMTADPRIVVLTVILGAAAAAPATAQSPTASTRPKPVLEGALGWAGFGDEGIVHHALAGAAARVYVSPRFSLGPEVAYMVGPGQDRDLIVTGNLMFDVLAPTAARPRRVTPFLVAGGGLYRHSNTFLTGTYATTEGAFTVGLGVRAWTTRRTFVAVDARLGWEPHIRLAATVGTNLSRD